MFLAWAGDASASPLPLKASTLRVYVQHINLAFVRARGVPYALPSAGRVRLVLRDIAAAPHSAPAPSLPLPVAALQFVGELPPVLHAAVTIGFLFLLRVGEYAYRGDRGTHTLRASDVTLVNQGRTLRVVLSTRKQNPLFPSIYTRDADASLGPACPVTAWLRYSSSPGAARRDASSPVFLHETGSPLHPSDVSDAVARLAARLVAIGRIPAALLPRYTPHSLRKGGATAPYARGVDIQTIQRLGGWQSATSLLVYCRLFAGGDAAMSAEFAAALASSRLLADDGDDDA